MIAGSSTAKYNARYATKLLTIDGQSYPQEVAELNTKDEGADWIGISQELRKAIVVTENGSAVAVDLDAAAVSKRCKWPRGNGTSAIDQWIVNTPSRGPVLAVELAPANIKESYISAMSLSAVVPCDQSFANMQAADIQHVDINGDAGIADTGAPNSLMIHIDQRGAISTWLPEARIYLGYSIPVELIAGIKEPYSSIVTNDNSAR